MNTRRERGMFEEQKERNRDALCAMMVKHCDRSKLRKYLHRWDHFTTKHSERRRVMNYTTKKMRTLQTGVSFHVLKEVRLRKKMGEKVVRMQLQKLEKICKQTIMATWSLNVKRVAVTKKHLQSVLVQLSRNAIVILRQAFFKWIRYSAHEGVLDRSTKARAVIMLSSLFDKSIRTRCILSFALWKTCFAEYRQRSAASKIRRRKLFRVLNSIDVRRRAKHVAFAYYRWKMVFHYSIAKALFRRGINAQRVASKSQTVSLVNFRYKTIARFDALSNVLKVFVAWHNLVMTNKSIQHCKEAQKLRTQQIVLATFIFKKKVVIASFWAWRQYALHGNHERTLLEAHLEQLRPLGEKCREIRGLTEKTKAFEELTNSLVGKLSRSRSIESNLLKLLSDATQSSEEELMKIATAGSIAEELENEVYDSTMAATGLMHSLTPVNVEDGAEETLDGEINSSFGVAVHGFDEYFIETSNEEESIWDTFMDDSSGQYYYHNAITGVTTWDKPNDTFCPLKLSYHSESSAELPLQYNSSQMRPESKAQHDAPSPKLQYDEARMAKLSTLVSQLQRVQR
jgi:hypothetical protein